MFSRVSTITPPVVSLSSNHQTDMAVFGEENPQYSTKLLSFVLEYLIANYWPGNSLMKEYNDCDNDCEQGQTKPCGCTCTTDPMEWEDDVASTQTVAK